MRLSLSFLFVICGLFGYAQVIENPVFDRTDQPLFHVDKVELTQDSTIVFCTLSVEGGMWANLSPDTYIENTLTAEKLSMMLEELFTHDALLAEMSQYCRKLANIYADIKFLAIVDRCLGYLTDIEIKSSSFNARYINDNVGLG